MNDTAPLFFFFFFFSLPLCVGSYPLALIQNNNFFNASQDQPYLYIEFNIMEANINNTLGKRILEKEHFLDSDLGHFSKVLMWECERPHPLLYALKFLTLDKQCDYLA